MPTTGRAEELELPTTGRVTGGTITGVATPKEEDATVYVLSTKSAYEDELPYPPNPPYSPELLLPNSIDGNDAIEAVRVGVVTSEIVAGVILVTIFDVFKGVVALVSGTRVDICGKRLADAGASRVSRVDICGKTPTDTGTWRVTRVDMGVRPAETSVFSPTGGGAEADSLPVMSAAPCLNKSNAAKKYRPNVIDSLSVNDISELI